MDRRKFLLLAAQTCASTLVPHCRAWAFNNGTDNPDTQKLVVVILRGGVDGLNVIIPHGDKRYYDLRPSIAVQRGSLIDLDGHFGMHPSLSPLQPLWKNHTLAFVHASGSPDPTRSHFDAQDYLESGTPGKKIASGWLNRMLTQIPTKASSPIRAISIGPTLPRIMSGPFAVATVAPEMKARALESDKPAIAQAFDKMYSDKHQELSKIYGEAINAHKEVSQALDAADREDKQEQIIANHGAPLPRNYNYFGKQIAALFRTDPSVQVAFVDFGGWDTHINQGSAQGQLANHLSSLASGLADLSKGLGPLYARTKIIVMSEFGRTVKENGNSGTDHGHGNVMWLMGGPVSGGKVFARWSGLNDANLYEGRDLPATTDFRNVLVASVADHMQLSSQQIANIFPDFASAGNPFIQS
ncbi:MAG TPA: DUF1501 domain-containing protein [Planktothrix sp.]|jgi:uncharacterized protein (DUF1501 family)